MMQIIFSTAFSIFLLMDPIGNIPIYLTILGEIESKRRTIIIIREKFIALIIILLFALFGTWFLNFLHITHDAIYLEGGVVLFVMAIKMIFPEKGSLYDSLGIEGEPFIFPLAIPLVAGPSVLAAVVIYSAQLMGVIPLFAAVLLAWIVSTLILVMAGSLSKWLGSRGIKALERLMGLILILIAINMLLEGIKLFLTLKKI